MPGFTMSFGIIEGQAEVVEFESNGEGGEETLHFPIPPDTGALLIVTEGDGRGYLTINGFDVTFEATRTTLVTRTGIQTYINTAPRPGEGTLTLSYEPDRHFAARLVRFTWQPFDWVKKQIHNRGPCWTCKQIVRALLRAIGGAVGIPDIPLPDDLVGEGANVLEQVVGDPSDLPTPLKDLLERFFGDGWPEVVRRILRGLAQGPFGLIADKICRQLGYCPSRASGEPAPA